MVQERIHTDGGDDEGMLDAEIAPTVPPTAVAAATNTAIKIAPAAKAKVPNACHKNNKDTSTCVPTAYFIGASKCATTSFALAFKEHPFMRGVAWGHESEALSHGAPCPSSHMVNSVKAHMSCTSDGANVGGLEVKLSNSKRLYANGTSNDKGTLPLTYFYKPDALFYPHAARNLALAESKYPKVGYPYPPKTSRFLVMLREPIGRTFSSWSFKVESGGGKETRPWVESVRHGLGVLASTLNCLDRETKKGSSVGLALENMCAATHFDPRSSYFHHVMKSVYSLQFEVWFKRFSKSQFHILFMEDFIRDPVENLEVTLDFFGVPMVDEGKGKWGYPSRKVAEKVVRTVKNQTKGKKHTLDAPTKGTREALDLAFAPFNCRLAQQLGLGRAAEGHWVTGRVSSSLGPESRVPWLTQWGPVLEGREKDPCLKFEDALRKRFKGKVNSLRSLKAH